MIELRPFERRIILTQLDPTPERTDQPLERKAGLQRQLHAVHVGRVFLIAREGGLHQLRGAGVRVFGMTQHVMTDLVSQGQRRVIDLPDQALLDKTRVHAHDRHLLAVLLEEGRKRVERVFIDESQLRWPVGKPFRFLGDCDKTRERGLDHLLVGRTDLGQRRPCGRGPCRG